MTTKEAIPHCLEADWCRVADVYRAAGKTDVEIGGRRTCYYAGALALTGLLLGGVDPALLQEELAAHREHHQASRVGRAPRLPGRTHVHDTWARFAVLMGVDPAAYSGLNVFFRGAWQTLYVASTDDQALREHVASELDAAVRELFPLAPAVNP